ncbi:hypothetical protein EPUS_07845 [Endocarpon pusillum Z07020]|uniref:Uncharacterized protein n=1 Tax=Endocarpon pusillum (strain Z07020 / HMAS-L-300199) TaxID=1263415 RepID=U1GCL3_ENDPU|nr:uncharacterized protein EPUS_07845 [Endocarpon pusillum Z07020]ERF69441.1 hypothetical protein EPUS_07845 [Endocarpon pusillum Z07020]
MTDSKPYFQVPKLASGPQWPASSKYFVPGMVDIGRVKRLLTNDTRYPSSGEEDLSGLWFATDGTVRRLVSTSIEEDRATTSISPLQGGTVVIFVKQKRRVFLQASYSEIQLRSERWHNLLEHLHILPPAIQGLHDNNGGHGIYVSSCVSGGIHACNLPFPADQPCAYHIWFKLGTWSNAEHFIYARYDFHTGSSIILDAGTDGELHAEKLIERLQGVPNIHIFNVILALLALWFYQTDDYRWQLDYATQAIESKTGYNGLASPTIKPLAPQELTLTKDIAQAADRIQGTITTATNLANLFQFAQDQWKQFINTLETSPAPPIPIPSRDIAALSNALLQLLSQVTAQLHQTRGLRIRVEAQFHIINSLIAQRDNQANIDLASAALMDTEIMRDISLVTYLFLPGTFLAAFFSMVFFERDSNSHLVVSKWIWIYFACAVPLTLGLASRYVWRQRSRRAK